MSDQPAKKIGKYEILEEIGRNALAVVYRTRDIVSFRCARSASEP